MPTTPQGELRPHATAEPDYSMVEYQDWVHLRTHISCLAHSVLVEVKTLYELAPGGETSQSLVEIRDDLIDLLAKVRAAKGGVPC
jgi:hypothetical protein